ncbi:MAG: glycerol-3-phosphate 1-O-acyltransferase PlsY [Candidatus Eremiobacteraeota bacterium]|nr:glycerol-3-phosphate 1-O-acyltransferase PlsY [Candidatus Eremiobacteraeota bacterium]
MIVLAIAASVAAFFIGSIPFGYLIGRFFYGTDIRTQGSGNIGAANALRTLGKRGGIAILLLDAAKGALPVLIAKTFGIPWLSALVAAAAVSGHCFSPWLGWKGGKGVATALGAIAGLSWQAALVWCAAWALGAGATAYSSVGSLLANVAAPFALWFFTREPAYVAYGVYAALLIIYRHSSNIARLREGREAPLRLLRPWRRPNEGNGVEAPYSRGS